MPIIDPRLNMQRQPAPRRTVVPQEQRLQHVLPRLAAIRSELYSATYATIVRDRLRETLDLLEFLLTGAVSENQPNQIPGTPASVLDDPTKTRVEFVSHHVPASPVNSGDVLFTPGPSGSTGHPQDVEFFQGQASGQRVEFFPSQPATPAVTSPAPGTPSLEIPTRSTEAGGRLPTALPIPVLQE